MISTIKTVWLSIEILNILTQIAEIFEENTGNVLLPILKDGYHYDNSDSNKTGDNVSV